MFEPDLGNRARLGRAEPPARGTFQTVVQSGTQEGHGEHGPRADGSVREELRKDEAWQGLAAEEGQSLAAQHTQNQLAPTAMLSLAAASSQPFSTHQPAPGEEYLPRRLCSGSCQNIFSVPLLRQIVFLPANRNAKNSWGQGGGGGGLEGPDPWLLERAVTAKPWVRERPVPRTIAENKTTSL